MTVEPTKQATDTWVGDFIARSQTCPQCFGPAAGHKTRKAGRVMAAEYECGMSHRWNLTWVLPRVADVG